MLTNKTHMYELNFFNKIIDAHKKGTLLFLHIVSVLWKNNKSMKNAIPKITGA